ncbi:MULTISPECIES: hypothetical protein [Acinetobacter]|jgi:hypothetical protein|uniref:hypothetical protein n=1 Tax=Acinetobacter TaxID=469 RepID=UPI0004DAFB4B|nr:MULTISPECIES: hypothetical protein [unclassified Acinetobacter]KEC83686.1 hypothetical protein DT74_14020 [Acinetobacter sp. ETR1]MCG7219405.1 hypothetical protein [Acinetobacter sp. AG3]UOH18007.1 hypothetical protein MTO68_19720 [Acinetobacter sp. NyZ410]WEE40172.1 hypothetical protein PYV58_03130 [Acinetobacter sp. TAC-1]
MKAEALTNELLDYLMTPPKTFLYWRIKDTYLIVAIIEEWDKTTITLKTEEGMVSKEKRVDVKIMVP